MSQSNGNGVQDSTSAPPEENASETASDAQVESEPKDELTAIAEERDRLKDKLLRTAADFDNFRKRSRRDLVDAERRGREEVFGEVLPVIDNLERAVAASTTAADAKSVADGVRMVLKQFEDAAGRLNVERLQAIGERFDPSLHDAVQQQETSEHPAGTIIGEVIPGYMMGGRLLRPAMVVVARPPAAPAGEPPAGDPPADADAASEEEEESES